MAAAGAQEPLCGSADRGFVHGAREGQQPMNLERILRNRAAWLLAQPNPRSRGVLGTRQEAPGEVRRSPGRPGQKGLKATLEATAACGDFLLRPTRPGKSWTPGPTRPPGGASAVQRQQAGGSGGRGAPWGTGGEAGGGRASWRLWGYDSPHRRWPGARAEVCSEGHTCVCAESEI